MNHIVQAHLSTGWVSQQFDDAASAAALFDLLRTRYATPVRLWADGRVIEQTAACPVSRRAVDPAPA